MDQVQFAEDSLEKIWRDIVYLRRPYPFKFFKGCLPQILPGSFLNILSQILLRLNMVFQEKDFQVSNVMWNYDLVPNRAHQWTGLSTGIGTGTYDRDLLDERVKLFWVEMLLYIINWICSFRFLENLA